MKKVLFICSGNICRSPMAEYIFNKMAKEEGLDWEAASAGIHAWPGDAISEHARTVLQRQYGVDASRHRAEPARASAVMESELVLSMTRAHTKALRQAFPDQQHKIHPLNQFIAQSGLQEEKAAPLDISDPYGGDYAVYENCAVGLHQSLLRLIDLLRLRD